MVQYLTDFNVSNLFREDGLWDPEKWHQSLGSTIEGMCVNSSYATPVV